MRAYMCLGLCCAHMAHTKLKGGLRQACPCTMPTVNAVARLGEREVADREKRPFSWGFLSGHKVLCARTDTH